MGAAKDLMIQMDDLRPVAGRIAVAAGALSRCSVHNDILIEQFDDGALTEAYRIANARITAGEIDLGDLSRRDFTDLIKKVVSESAMDCWRCAKHDRE
jgi:hypothetical protein